MEKQKIFKTKIDDRGRIYIPRTVRRQFRMKNGQTLIMIADKESFTVYPDQSIEQKLIAALSDMKKKEETFAR